MAVSENAISTLAGVANVYVIEDGKVRQQTVTLGTRIGNLYEILSGLRGNEILAASNLTLLATGVPVKVLGSSDSDLPVKSQKPQPEKRPDQGIMEGRL